MTDKTTDLLARLRQVDPPGEGERTRWMRNPDGLEAAAEIERLRAALRWANGEIGEWRDRQPGEGAFYWRREMMDRANGKR